MKKASFYILIFLWVSISSAIAADTFYVIHLKGTATNKTTGTPIKVGDQISSNDQVKFGSKDAAVVIMGAKGKYTLSPAVSDNNSSELVAFVQSALVPLKSNGHLSTRGAESEKIIDLKGYFGTSKFFIIGDKLTIALDQSKYPVSDKKMFIFRYIHKDTVVSKKVETNGTHIIINKKTLYTIKGTYVDPEKIANVDLYYYNSETKNSTKVVNFTPHFINEETLKEELKVQKNILKGQNLSEEQINKELLSFMSDVYGRTDEAIFNKWVKTNIHAE